MKQRLKRGGWDISFGCTHSTGGAVSIINVFFGCMYELEFEFKDILILLINGTLIVNRILIILIPIEELYYLDGILRQDMFYCIEFVLELLFIRHIIIVIIFYAFKEELFGLINEYERILIKETLYLDIIIFIQSVMELVLIKHSLNKLQETHGPNFGVFMV